MSNPIPIITAQLLPGYVLRNMLNTVFDFPSEPIHRPILNSDGSKIRLFEFTARERGNR